MNIPLFLEMKSEFTEHLLDAITPYIYEGLTSIYKSAVDASKRTGRNSKTLKTFQIMLHNISTWNQQQIEDETNRISILSLRTDHLDDLVKVVMKTHIILLTYSNNISSVIGQNFYSNFKTSTFIHQTYIEAGKYFHNNPYLFYHDIEPFEYKRNQAIILNQIRDAIVRAVRKVLPLTIILKEFLANTCNIINEPVVELVRPCLKSDSKNEVDNYVHKMITSEKNLTNEQQLDALMKINKMMELHPSPSVRSIVSPKRSEYPKPSFINDVDIGNDTDNEINDLINFGQVNNDETEYFVNMDNEPTKSISHKKSSSRTPSRTMNTINPETTERVDPSKVTLIESYGPNSRQYKTRPNQYRNV